MNRLRMAVAGLRHTPLHPQWLLPRRHVPEMLAARVGRLLDVGAADRWLEPRISADLQYVALDYPATAMEMYRSRPDVFADAAVLPFADATFDTVVCFEVLEHLREPQRALAEMARVTRAGGMLFASMPFLYPIHDAPHDYQRYTESGLQHQLARAGWSASRVTPHGRPIQTAGLLFCLALAGPLQRSRGIGLLLAVPAVLLIACINLGAWLLARLWPGWDAMPSGYLIEARRV